MMNCGESFVPDLKYLLSLLIRFAVNEAKRLWVTLMMTIGEKNLSNQMIGIRFD